MNEVATLIPWQRVRVEGSSMTPTLLPGDWLLVLHGGRVRPGALVLARFHSRPELAVLKRALTVQDGGWLVGSDNAGAGTDSRQLGVAEVAAVVVWQWPVGPGRHPEPWLARWFGRRPAGVDPRF